MRLKKPTKSKYLFILNIIKPYRKYLIVLLILSFLASVLDGLSISMMVPLLSSLQHMQDHEQLHRFLRFIVQFFSAFSQNQQILYAGILLMLAVLGKNLFLGISLSIGRWLSGKLSSDIRCQAVDLIMSVDIAFFNKIKVGHLKEKILGNTVKIEDIFQKITVFVVNLTTLIVLLVLMVIFSWQYTIMALLFGIGIAFGMGRYTKVLTPMGRRTAVSKRDLTGSIIETIIGMPVIKYFTKGTAQSSLLKRKIEIVRINRFRLKLRYDLLHVVTECSGIIAIGILFFITIFFHNENRQLLMTQLLPFIYILTRIIPVIKVLNHSIGVIAGEWPFISIVEDLLCKDNKPFMKDGDKPFRGLTQGIRFKGITFSYHHDDKPALLEADFYIPRGKTTAFVGKSGAGKSTIINLLTRFYDPQQGCILIDDKPLQHFQIQSFRRAVGVVSQDTFIFNDTARNNIAFGALEYPDEEMIISAAQMAGAHEFIMDLPQGYDTVLGDRGVRLSGGERQRISIGRMILKNPEIIILDEATSALDTHTEQLIHKAMKKLCHNRTVVIIAHRFSTIKDADQYIVLKKGRVFEVGKEINFFDQEGEYYRLVKDME